MKAVDFAAHPDIGEIGVDGVELAQYILNAALANERMAHVKDAVDQRADDDGFEVMLSAGTRRRVEECGRYHAGKIGKKRRKGKQKAETKRKRAERWGIPKKKTSQVSNTCEVF